MKAIETVYNGYRFRSRLEARWAVFFDAMGIKYEYEPEGYNLPRKQRYLPDFFFPEQDGIGKDWSNTFGEVKPYAGVKQDIIEFILKKDAKKLCSLIKMFNGKYRGILLDGPPDFHWYISIEYEDKEFTFIDEAFLLWQAGREDRFYVYSGCDRDEFDSGDFDKRYVHGVYKSRQARFEHGGKP